MRSVRVLGAATMLAAAAACTSPTAPSTIGFTQTDLIVGAGATADAGESITVDYTGWIYDTASADHKGLQFDSSVGDTPFTFTLGAGDVIDGFDQGVEGMKVGGTRQLVIPPSLAYGDVRNGSIPANSTLLFEITLIDAP